MKITNNNYPALEYFDNKSLPENYSLVFNKIFKDSFCSCDNIKKYYISEPFYLAFFKNKDKILNLVSSELKNDKNLFNELLNTGVFIIGNKVLGFNMNNDHLDYVEFVKNVISTYSFKDSSYVHPELIREKFNNNDAIIKNKYLTIMGLAFFIKFCDIETKIIKPQNKILLENKTKFKNESKRDIIYLTSSWFTNLVSKNEFKVSGHLRLQPYSDGTKKLIWINEFKKKGYTRKAGRSK